MTNDTICAISTAPGVGGIAVIRISGTEAFSICDKLFHSKIKGKRLSNLKAYTLSYGTIEYEGEAVDDVVAAVFRAPHSFTGEDTVEITCHGSIYIQQRILQLLLSIGCRMAMPGEYTQRAFLNGKMDLSQAEAVADLIASLSKEQHELALKQMRGGFSNELMALREQLLKITSLMELELDFSDHEDLEFASRSELKDLTAQIEKVITGLVNSFKVGNAIKNGIPVAIIGETNAGKSTLLNVLLNEEKAIVSDIHGTTRDAIEDTTNLGGLLFRFIDTAGIRETSDTIESLGIERTFKKIEQASIVLWVIDATVAEKQMKELKDRIIPSCKDKELIIVINKSDLSEHNYLLEKSCIPETLHTIFISAKERKNITQLQELLIKVANINQNGSNIIVSNLRHLEALTYALEAIKRVKDGLNNNISGDFIAQDLRECIFHLTEITGGEITTNEVLGNIFKNFCVGK